MHENDTASVTFRCFVTGTVVTPLRIEWSDAGEWRSARWTCPACDGFRPVGHPEHTPSQIGVHTWRGKLAIVTDPDFDLAGVQP